VADRKGKPTGGDTAFVIFVGGRAVHRHGHVVYVPDGHVARCGGPAICEVCREEERRKART
jgi:hypothetical protein